MKKIKLRGKRGGYALIDDEDFEKVKILKWYHASIGYPRVYFKGKDVSLHRFIMNFPKGLEIDHINQDKLDNRKANLRICSRVENQRNTKKRASQCSSRYKGVSWHKGANKWMLQIVKGGIYFYGSLLKNEIEAAKKYDEMAKELFGKYASANF